MRKLIGVIAVISLLVVAFFAPVGAQAESASVCNEQTQFRQPSSKPYLMHWRGSTRHIGVKGSVAGIFTGACRGFLTGTVKVLVHSPNGGVLENSRTYTDKEFKNGLNDTGKRFTFHYGLIYTQPIPAGTCVTVTVHWQNWRYNDNELVSNGPAKTLHSRGCFQNV